MNKSILGAVLAGGQSRRMGRDKATLLFRGRPLIQHVSGLLLAVFSDVVIISGCQRQYEFMALPVLADAIPDCGPLGGIYTALGHAGGRAAFVLACDLPFISQELIEYVLDFPIQRGALPPSLRHSNRFEEPAVAKIPLQNGQEQPLCGLYSQGCLPLIENRLKRQKYKVLDFLKIIETVPISITPEQTFYTENLLCNINTPEDYERMCEGNS
ncbi:molybdenum cofactor guanylyltransferase [Acidobacteria bacterium AH-259-A15]|nr:molybdenum cofactor guanylyltransferase [Acidobacteria bacterium AH-259-A15]